MGYKVNFDALDSFNSGVNSQLKTWSEELINISNAVTVIINSTNMSGAGADSIRIYFENVHGMIFSLFDKLLANQQSNCFLYKRDYFSNIDSGLHAVINEDELSGISRDIKSHNNRAIAVEGCISDALSRVKDIFYISYKDVGDVDRAHTSVTGFISNLDSEIKDLENNHYNNDFINTQQLIDALEAFIKELIAQNRKYKTEFSIDRLTSSRNFRNIYNAYIDICKEEENKAELITEEIKNEEQRVADLQAEYEERQKKANAQKWIVTGVCVIGSIAVIAATGGAATPLVIGAVSATSGAVIAGTNNLADQYVQHGNILENGHKYDWASFGKDVVVSAATGFITGYLGAGMGNVITNKLAGTAVGNTLLHSSSAITRIGTGAAIGMVSEVSSGIITRGASATVEGIANGNWNAGDVLGEMFDGQQILVDAAIGGVGGGVDQYMTTKRAQKAADDYALEYNGKHDPIKDGEKAGLENLKTTDNNGVDFSDSDYIFRTESGDPIEIKIKSTGDRQKDYKLAEKILKEEYNIDIDFKTMRTGKNKTHVWHHLDDYNVATNETTLQFIDIDAHKAIKQHAGSAKQYHIANGKGYGKDSFKTDYNLDITGKISMANSNISITSDNIFDSNDNMYTGFNKIEESYFDFDGFFERLSFDE